MQYNLVYSHCIIHVTEWKFRKSQLWLILAAARGRPYTLALHLKCRSGSPSKFLQVEHCDYIISVSDLTVF